MMVLNAVFIVAPAKYKSSAQTAYLISRLIYPPAYLKYPLGYSMETSYVTAHIELKELKIPFA